MNPSARRLSVRGAVNVSLPLIAGTLGLALRAVARVVCGPDGACADPAHDSCYVDSRGVYRCRSCALPLEGAA